MRAAHFSATQEPGLSQLCLRSSSAYRLRQASRSEHQGSSGIHEYAVWISKGRSNLGTSRTAARLPLLGCHHAYACGNSPVPGASAFPSPCIRGGQHRGNGRTQPRGGHRQTGRFRRAHIRTEDRRVRTGCIGTVEQVWHTPVADTVRRVSGDEARGGDGSTGRPQLAERKQGALRADELHRPSVRQRLRVQGE